MNKKTIYPVYKEIPADIETPVSAFLVLKEDKQKAFLLESVELGDKIGRYSFLGFEPELEFIAKKNKVKIISQGKTEEFESANPIDEVKKIVHSFNEIKSDDLPPFSSGLVGYFGYDAVRYFENIPDTKPDRLNLPDICLILPRILIAFDHIQQKIIIISYSYSRNDQKEALMLIKKYEDKLYHTRATYHIEESKDSKISLYSNFKKDDFVEAIKKAKEYIVAGDIFQVLISQQFKTKTELPPFDIYRKLRMINPSPYMYYMDFLDFQIIGTSPEVMVKRIKDEIKDEVLIRPIAGTRKRGRDKMEDQALEKGLLSDEKELAEHTMLLDLARNDAGRICEYSTISVDKAFHIERYSHVMHIVSDVTGRPKKEYDALDIIGAAYPAGTVTGAPKYPGYGNYRGT